MLSPALIIWYEEAAITRNQHYLCFCRLLESKLHQKLYKCYFCFNQCKPHANTISWTMAKWHKMVGVYFALVFWAESAEKNKGDKLNLLLYY